MGFRSGSHTNYRMTTLCCHVQNKANKKINRTPLKIPMFDIIKELYVLSVMQNILPQPTTVKADIFNRHFYGQFYRSEV